ncbi:MAG: hypothetical protein K2I07_02420 [Lachnospiraceae bacterium]|nr:hypothetical protein [Lachnospiraceae bacterium]
MPILEIAKINLRHNSVLSIAVCAAILIMTPILYGTANLDAASSAAPLEMFVSFIGIVLLTPVFGPEQNQETSDLVSSKYIGTTTIYLVRIVCAMILLFAMTGLFCIFMRLQKCDVTLLLFFGTAANAVFLGSLGMITAALTDNTVIAYMIPLVYYALNYGMGGKLGNYFLFSMRVADFQPKMWLFPTGILLLVLSLIVKRLKQKLL